MKRLRNKGLAYLLPLAIGLITLTAGVAMMFILPEFILSALNDTGEGGLLQTGSCHTWNTSAGQCPTTAATCCVDYDVYYNARTKLAVVRNLGMAVIVIAIVWIIIGVISGKKGGGV